MEHASPTPDDRVPHPERRGAEETRKLSDSRGPSVDRPEVSIREAYNAVHRMFSDPSWGDQYGLQRLGRYMSQAVKKHPELVSETYDRVNAFSEALEVAASRPLGIKDFLRCIRETALSNKFMVPLATLQVDATINKNSSRFDETLSRLEKAFKGFVMAHAKPCKTYMEKKGEADLFDDIKPMLTGLVDLSNDGLDFSGVGIRGAVENFELQFQIAKNPEHTFAGVVDMWKESRREQKETLARVNSVLFPNKKK